MSAPGDASSIPGDLLCGLAAAWPSRGGQQIAAYASERKIRSLETVHAIAHALGSRYRALVYTAALAGLRAGELSGLERRHIDLVHRTVTVEQQAQVVVGQGRVLGPTKSEAGRRTVAISDELGRILDHHLANYVKPQPDAVVFTGDKGAPITT